MVGAGGGENNGEERSGVKTGRDIGGGKGVEEVGMFGI